MYTLCPECKKQQTISTEQLRETRGMLKCPACQTMFDALEYISDEPADNTPISKTDSRDFLSPVAEQPKQNTSRYWILSLIGLSVLLFAQIYYFESYQLSQNPALRPWLNKFCQLASCTLPPYKNPAEISIVSSSIKQQNTRHTVFKIALVNQAEFPQPYPAIQLSLFDYTGQAFAERVFSADNYQPAQKFLAAGQSAEIQLDIIPPKTGIGGYSFKIP